MCNSQKMTKSIAEIAAWFTSRTLPLALPEGAPNLEPRDIKITDMAPIIRRGAEGYELVNRRWSWPGPTGKPVYNFRSEGRKFAQRCLIVTEAFYEFTEPQPGEKRKTRWAFTMPGEDWFGIAGTWKATQAGEAWSMLTTEPGPDVAPYHGRQVVALGREAGLRWLDGAPEAEMLRAGPAGSLIATRA